MHTDNSQSLSDLCSTCRSDNPERGGRPPLFPHSVCIWTLRFHRACPSRGCRNNQYLHTTQPAWLPDPKKTWLSELGGGLTLRDGGGDEREKQFSSRPPGEAWRRKRNSWVGIWGPLRSGVELNKHDVCHSRYISCHINVLLILCVSQKAGIIEWHLQSIYKSI